jgi:hypothetical protein
MIDDSLKKNLAKWAKWIGIGLLSSLLILSPYFWLGLLLFGYSMLSWIVEELKKVMAQSVRSGFRVTKNTIKRINNSKNYNANQNVESRDKNGF